MEIDLPLAQFRFMQDLQSDRYEWLYLGSPRIEQVWRKLIEKKLLDNVLNFEFIEEDSSNSNDECVMIERCTLEMRPTRRFNEALISNGVESAKNHECNHHCVWLEDIKPIETFSLFHRPLAVGFKRHIDKKQPFYTSPCGRRLTTYQIIRTYLLKINSKLRIDSFSLEKNFDPSENRQLTYQTVEVIFE